MLVRAKDYKIELNIAVVKAMDYGNRRFSGVWIDGKGPYSPGNTVPVRPIYKAYLSDMSPTMFAEFKEST